MKTMQVFLTLFISLVFSITCWGQIAQNETSITSEDGFILRGIFFSSGKKGPGILLLHQCNRSGEKTGYENLAPLLALNGFNTLVLDSRGFGKSTDETYRDYRSQMDLIDTKVQLDVEAAFRFLSTQPHVDPQRIGIVGASCGTWASIPLAKRHPEIRALVFLSGSYLGLGQQELDYDALVQRPVLTIYSEEDRYRTPESMKDAFSRSKNKNSKLIAYKGSLHGTLLLDNDKNLEKEIVRWLQARLIGE